MEIKPPFEEVIPIVEEQINRRRNRWTLTAVSFEDLRQIITIHAFVKYHTFDPQRGPFLNWINRVITHQIRNVLRNNFTIYSRPCIQGCPFNTGGDGCSKTTHGKQGPECLIYRIWEKKKLSHHNVKQTLPLETHIKEIDSQPGDFIDIESRKKVIDSEMKKRLNPKDYKIYKALYIDNKSEKEVGGSLGLKKVGRMWSGYQRILQAKKVIVATAKCIIEEEDLA
jgi:RNA polymerase sigma factor (sigma-70 family)